MNPETDFLTEKLKEHETKALRAEIDTLKDHQRRVQDTLDTLTLPNGGQIALPYIAPEGGGGRSITGSGQTISINYFADGALESALVPTEGTSTFGPF